MHILLGWVDLVLAITDGKDHYTKHESSIVALITVQCVGEGGVVPLKGNN